MANADALLTSDLASYISAVKREIDHIPADRRQALALLSSFVSERSKAGKGSKLTFICTHNSRRSHLAQIWAQTAVHYCAVRNVETYSGGTESTAFNPRAVEAIRRAGFLVDSTQGDSNPVYEVRSTGQAAPMRCFSKVYDQPPNPREDYAAVMTCSAADQGCPIVNGAVERFAMIYDDPKAFDGTDLEAQKYDERCRQIAREMFYVFRNVQAS